MAKYLLLLLALLTASPALAAQWGVTPLPRRLMEMRIEDFVEAINIAQSVPAPVFTTLQTWKELEPEEGTYDIKTKLGGLLYTHKQGMIIYYGINLINTTRRDMPSYVEDKDWSDPALQARFAALIQAYAPHLPRDLPTFIIGNEVDIYFEKNPDELDGYLAFYAKARDEVRKHFPHAKVGMAVTYEGLNKGGERTAIVTRVLEASDAAFFTFYPVFDLKVAPPAQTPAMLDNIIRAARGKDVYLQEVGYPSTPFADSSPQMQAEFFRHILPAIAARPQIKMASIFTLYDFEPDFCDKLASYYGLGGLISLVFPTEKFEDFLCSLGLRDTEGKPKPAWDEVVKAMRAAPPAR